MDRQKTDQKDCLKDCLRPSSGSSPLYKIEEIQKPRNFHQKHSNDMMLQTLQRINNNDLKLRITSKNLITKIPLTNNT